MIGDANFSDGKEINDAGVIMGDSFSPTTGLSVALWEPDGTGRLLPKPSNATDCEGFDLNNAGTVSGRCDIRTGSDRTVEAVVWIGEQPLLLRDLVDETAAGWNLQFAYGLNDLGWIVGVGTIDGVLDSNGNLETFGFLLKPAAPVAAEPVAETARFAVSAAPNPLGAAGTRLSFALGAPAEVSATVFDVRGRRVRTLDAGALGAGPHTLRWDGRDRAGRSVAPGVYVVRLTAGAERATLRVTVVR